MVNWVVILSISVTSIVIMKQKCWKMQLLIRVSLKPGRCHHTQFAVTVNLHFTVLVGNKVWWIQRRLSESCSGPHETGQNVQVNTTFTSSFPNIFKCLNIVFDTIFRQSSEPTHNVLQNCNDQSSFWSSAHEGNFFQI